MKFNPFIILCIGVALIGIGTAIGEVEEERREKALGEATVYCEQYGYDIAIEKGDSYVCTFGFNIETIAYEGGV